MLSMDAQRCAPRADVANQQSVWMVVSLGAYVGSLMRLGFQYLRGLASAPSNFASILYPQLIGCFIMGAASECVG
jgi:hypothetical protein